MNGHPAGPPDIAASGALSLVLCADDYGMSPGISEAICRLLEAGRLSAASCMAIAEGWAAQAGWLKPMAARADIGLHLTLTDHPPLGAMPATAPDGRLPPLPALMRRALARRLDRAEIAAEIGRQIDAFEAAFGAPPAFLDGHQHVHQLPVIRAAVLDALRNRLAGAAYVRVCWDSPWAILRRGVAVPKTLLIAGLGLRFRRMVAAGGLPANSRFRGVYGFGGDRPYAELFPVFLRNLVPGTLIMCHPGAPEAAPAMADPIAARRREEYAYLGSDAFLDALQRSGARLRPYRRLAR